MSSPYPTLTFKCLNLNSHASLSYALRLTLECLCLDSHMSLSYALRLTLEVPLSQFSHVTVTCLTSHIEVSRALF